MKNKVKDLVEANVKIAEDLKKSEMEVIKLQESLASLTTGAPTRAAPVEIAKDFLLSGPPSSQEAPRGSQTKLLAP